MPWTVTLARTRWIEIYRARINGENGEPVALLRLIPAMPIDREQLPPDAPDAPPYLLVIVEEAIVTPETLIDFEARITPLLLTEIAKAGFEAAHCEFCYPSPSFLPQA